MTRNHVSRSSARTDVTRSTPNGVPLVSTMPAPLGFLEWAIGEKISGFTRFLILITS